MDVMHAHPTEHVDNLRLGAIALDMVRRSYGGPEQYMIHPLGPEVIRAAVQAVILSGESTAKMAERFREVIALCYTLRIKGCPRAAGVVAAALLSNERVARILDAHRGQADTCEPELHGLHCALGGQSQERPMTLH